MNHCQADLERRRQANEDASVSEIRGDFTRRIEFVVGYDHRAFPDDCSGGGHGQHGMTACFYLIGSAGAVQFTFNLLDFVPGNMDQIGGINHHSELNHSAMATDLGYHWPTVQYEGQASFECELIPGGHCYYDGSGLNAIPILRKFLEGGPRMVWIALESYYRQLEAQTRLSQVW